MKWILASMLLFLFVVGTHALYEHEVGRNDWAIRTLGGEIYNSQISEKYPSYMVTLSSKILTAVNTNNGRVIWRKELDSSVCQQISLEGDYILLKSRYDLQVFVITTGELTASINSANAISTATLVAEEGKSPLVVFSEKDGQTFVYKNAKKVNTKETKYLSLGLDERNKLVGLTHTGSSHEVHSLDVDTLEHKILKQNVKISSKLSPMAHYRFTKKYFVIQDFEDREKLSSFDKIYFDGKVEHVAEAKGLSWKELSYTPNGVFAPISTNSLGSPFTLSVTGASLNIFKDQALVQTLTDITTASNGRILRVQIMHSALLVQMQDFSLYFIETDNYDILWKRQEAIANVEKFKFLDISEPVESKNEIIDFMKHLESMDDSIGKIPVKILTRYTYHIQKLIAFLSNLPAILQDKISPHQETVHEKDDFGFKKVLVGLTKTHDTLLGLQSNNGNLLWTLHFSKVFAESDFLTSQADKVVFSDFHLIDKEHEDNEAVAVFSTETGNTLVVTVDPYDGKVKSHKLYKNHRVTHSFKIHLASLHEVVIMVDEERKTLFYPKVENPKFDKSEENLEFYEGLKSFSFSFCQLRNENTLELVGESFDFDSCENPSVDSCLTTTWRIPFENQELVTHSTKYIPERTHFHSQKATNLNGAILYKYLEPTLFAVVTKSTHASGTNNGLFIYIIEGTTGRIVHQSYEMKVLLDKPITALFDENQLYLTFQREGTLGEGIQQIQTTSLYEENIRRNVRDVIVDYIKGVNVTTSYGEMPIILQQAYVFPYFIDSVGITRTQQGITGKDLLLSLENGHVYALKAQMVGTRRPVEKPVKLELPAGAEEEFEETLEDASLPQYDAYLPFIPQSIISHRNRMIGLEKFVTTPSKLESTSLMLSYGTDLFYSTVAPEKQFDVLSEDFNKLYLILTVIALMIGTRITSWYFNNKRAKAKIMKD